MKKQLMIQYSFLFWIIFLVSCDIVDQQRNNDLSVNNIYPIKTGNTWTYKITNSGLPNDTTVYMVGEKRVVDGYNCYEFVTNIMPGLTFIVGNDYLGNYVTYGYENGSNFDFARSIKYKIHSKLNESWSYMNMINDGAIDLKQISCQIKCISTDTIISTSNQTFHCIAFKDTSYAFTKIEYLTVNVGLVKSELFVYDRLMTTFELIDYKLVE